MIDPKNKTISEIVSIIIPSYNRPKDLHRCLTAIQKQTFRTFEALIVFRPYDTSTRNQIENFSNTDSRIKLIPVEKPGVIEALNTGFSAAIGKLITFTDDDSEAPPQWLSVIVEHFRKHPECGAVGGQDRLQINNEALSNPPIVKQVGCYSWTGKFHGNHHCPIKPEFVRSKMLKGVNMTFRRDIIQNLKIGENLRGKGTTVGWEASLAHRVTSQGYQMHFVRDAWIKHYATPRSENDHRTDFTTQFAFDSSYNNNYTLARYQGPLRWWIGLTRCVLLGSRHIPGLVRTLPKGRVPRLLIRHFPHMISGGKSGLKDRKSN